MIYNKNSRVRGHTDGHNRNAFYRTLIIVQRMTTLLTKRKAEEQDTSNEDSNEDQTQKKIARDVRGCRKGCNEKRQTHDPSCFRHRCTTARSLEKQQKVIKILKRISEKERRALFTGLPLTMARFNAQLAGRSMTEKEEQLRTAVRKYNCGSNEEIVIARALWIAVFERDLIHIYRILDNLKFDAHSRAVWTSGIQSQCRQVSDMFRYYCTRGQSCKDCQSSSTTNTA